MKKWLLCVGAGCSILAFAKIAVPVEVAKVVTPRDLATERVAPQRYTEMKSTKRFATSDAPFKADFSIEGVDASLIPMISYNFDDGYQGWTIENTTHATWSTKQISAPGTDKSFSNIDPTDVKSLYVEGDYRVYNREKTRAVSPKMTIPENAVLTFYVGCSLNWEDTNRLKLIVSENGFPEEGDEEETTNVLWCSSDETGARPWMWRKITVNLQDYIGKEVQFKFLYTYGSSDDIFRVGGYGGDYSIDNFVISGRQSVNHIDVMTGEEIHLVDITAGEITSWEWNMPGAVPSTSTEKNPTIYYTTDGDYDVSLTVSDAAGNTDTKTIANFVTVTGTAPVAKIVPPATFRYASNRLPMVAPLVPVTFHDGSSGFPTTRTWAFTGASEDPDEIVTSKEEHPEVAFAYLHEQTATMVSQNHHGTSSDQLEFAVEYYGPVTNVRPTDGATTFDMQDWGVFPGSNNHNFTAYAERFSKPSRPVMVSGAYVFFNRADAGDLVDQISSVGVHLYTSKDGKPDQKIDSFWWSVFELDTKNSAGDVVGTWFPFTYHPFVDDEFFIVVDGIPEVKEATQDAGATMVTFLMAPFRAEGNTALFLKDGEWKECSDYFPAGANHTSYYMYPVVSHSVMAPLSNDTGIIPVGSDEGTAEFQIFSLLGRTANPEIDCDWLRVASAPGEYTVDTLKIAYDKLPSGVKEREGHITLTDGASTLVLTVRQTSTTSVETVVASAITVRREGDILRIGGIAPEEELTIYAVNGSRVYSDIPSESVISIDMSAWNPGVYVLINGKNTYKFIK